MESNRILYGLQAHFSVFEDTMVEMTWQEVQAGADQNAIVLLPIGIVEGHGPHLDLSADFYLSTLGCRFLKQELENEGIEALIAPPFYWGISRDVAQYAGTFSVRPETMQALLADVFASLKGGGSGGCSSITHMGTCCTSRRSGRWWRRPANPRDSSPTFCGIWRSK